jgi:hypothetical protein
MEDGPNVISPPPDIPGKYQYIFNLHDFQSKFEKIPFRKFNEIFFKYFLLILKIILSYFLKRMEKVFASFVRTIELFINACWWFIIFSLRINSR